MFKRIKYKLLKDDNESSQEESFYSEYKSGALIINNFHDDRIYKKYPALQFVECSFYSGRAIYHLPRFHEHYPVVSKMSDEGRFLRESRCYKNVLICDISTVKTLQKIYEERRAIRRWFRQSGKRAKNSLFEKKDAKNCGQIPDQMLDVEGV